MILGLLTITEISKKSHASRVVKIVNHASRCYAQSRLTRLICAWSRITLITGVPSNPLPTCPNAEVHWDAFTTKVPHSGELIMSPSAFLSAEQVDRENIGFKRRLSKIIKIIKNFFGELHRLWKKPVFAWAGEKYRPLISTKCFVDVSRTRKRKDEL